MVKLRKGRKVASIPGTKLMPPPLHWLRKDGPLCCSDYGLYWKAFYKNQGSLFCHHCDLYDDSFWLDVNKKAMGNSATFKCMANHTSFAFPTDILVAKNLFYPLKIPHARPMITKLNNDILAESFEDKEYDDDVNEEANVNLTADCWKYSLFLQDTPKHLSHGFLQCNYGHPYHSW